MISAAKCRTKKVKTNIKVENAILYALCIADVFKFYQRDKYKSSTEIKQIVNAISPAMIQPTRLHNDLRTAAAAFIFLYDDLPVDPFF